MHINFTFFHPRLPVLCLLSHRPPSFLSHTVGPPCSLLSYRWTSVLPPVHCSSFVLRPLSHRQPAQRPQNLSPKPQKFYTLCRRGHLCHRLGRCCHCRGRSWCYRQELEDHTDQVDLQRDELDGMFTFYDSTRAMLNVYQGLDDLISLFRRPPSRKVKTA